MMKKVELWKDVKSYEGFEDFYMVSSLGRVKSKDRYVINRWKGETFISGKVLTPAISKGYPVVQLNKNSIVKSVKVHRLVALAFISNPHDKQTVNHKNGDKTDNRVINLEWSTVRENLVHALDTNLRVNLYGENHNMAKLSKDRVLLIREMWDFSEKDRIEKGFSRLDKRRSFSLTWLGKCFRVAISHISLIVKRKIWKHI